MQNCLSEVVVKHVSLTVTHHNVTNPINKIVEQKFFLPDDETKYPLRTHFGHDLVQPHRYTRTIL